MTDIEKKALALVNEMAFVKKDDLRHCSRDQFREALVRAIKQHEAFRQEVSDAVEDAVALIENEEPYNAIDLLSRFIIAKPDPLVEALDSLGLEKADEWAPDIRKALTARGGRIVWEGE